jgi:hypothetical protein
VPVTCPKGCSGRGTCTGTGKCLCSAGYSGEGCDINHAPCTSICQHGTCNSETSMCTCDQGWAGRKCDIADITLAQCPLSCSGHGTCINGFCACWPEYDGDSCQNHKESESSFVESVVNTSALTYGGLASSIASAVRSAQGENGSLRGAAASLLDAAPAVREPSALYVGLRNGPTTASWIPAEVPEAPTVSHARSTRDKHIDNRMLSLLAQTAATNTKDLAAPVQNRGTGPVMMSLLAQAAKRQQ